MPRYQIISYENQRFFPMRYDDLPVGESRAPATTLVPYFDCLSDALAAVEAHVESVLGPVRAMIAGTSARRDAHYRDKLANPTIFFRGQSSPAYSIVPTRFRLAGVTDPLAEVERRIRNERARAAAIQSHYRVRAASLLDDLQARAVARHFGAPSSLVDFTFDAEVAATFAHPAFSEAERSHGAPLGLLYALDMGQLQEMMGMLAWGVNSDGTRDIHLVNVKCTWGIPFLQWDAGAGEVAGTRDANPRDLFHEEDAMLERVAAGQ
ncbi:MAG: FRG domain-containing protein [Gemmatimonadaceae bacterium]